MSSYQRGDHALFTGVESSGETEVTLAADFDESLETIDRRTATIDTAQQTLERDLAIYTAEKAGVEPA
jgi:prefoldin subunit 5